MAEEKTYKYLYTLRRNKSTEIIQVMGDNIDMALHKAGLTRDTGIYIHKEKLT